MPSTCAECGQPIDPTALSCPSCHTLTRAAELESLSAKAQQAQSQGDLLGAKAFWEQAAALLPPETVQYSSIRARIAQIDATLADPAHKPGAKWGKGAAGIGTTLLLALSKAKFLLLGLTKISTLLSMLAFVGVYWALYGWRFAVGAVLLIYVHEMGHVMMLRSYGIPASAPMFIPGFGAFISMRGHAITRVQDSRVGLAGPIYGLGGAIFTLLVGHAIDSKVWMAIAHFTAVINLFNLIPIWQLDGGRGFASLTRNQRAMVLVTAIALWWITSESMLLLIAVGATYRLFTKDAAPEPDQKGLFQFLGLLAALTSVVMLAQRVVG
jgi:Zn-dependent protease